MKRILFVDDDTAILDGLRLRMRGLRTRWEMVFVESGSRAITEMEMRQADVVVTDMRMPMMDGAQFLAEVRERWPEAVRIVLSGYAEDEQASRLLTLAHQYLSKPEAGQLEQVIDRCLRLHEVLHDENLRTIVGRIRRLPAVPAVYARLRAVMTQPDVSVQKIAAIIQEDLAIAAKVLQVANSAFFRLSRRITRIDQAVGHLGFNAVRTLVLSAEVFSVWRRDAAPQGLEPERLQQRAQRVAGAARVLSAGMPIADDALLAGLFHNIGYWVLLQECPDELRRARALARAESIPMHLAERKLIGTSHAEVGAYMLGLWGLPHAVVEAIAFQHHARDAEHKEFDVLAALATAQCLTATDAATEPTEPAAQHGGVTFDDDYLQSLNAPFSWTEARQRVEGHSGDLP
jgi:HD-like signal output (HDOD) protein